MTILIVASDEDSWTANAVHESLLADGADAVRLVTEHFPLSLRMVAHCGNTGENAQLFIDGRMVDLASVSAVWHRRWRTAATVTSLAIPDDVRQGIQRESAASLEGVIGALPCFHLDQPAAIARARNRPLQLVLARQLGIDIPRTLTTNSPQDALSFFDDCNGDVIVKMLSSFSVRDESGHDKVVMTNRVTSEHLRKIDTLSTCPMTFQERIQKSMELRITVVGYEIFAASVDSGLEPMAETDFRRGFATLSQHWKPYRLPPEFAGKLLALMDALQMNYGAIDVIVTPDGRYVFLEDNPVGQFGWVEHATGMPIARTIAGLLTGRVPRRVDLPTVSCNLGDFARSTV
ncbi:hypothetical protein JHL17_15920 [Azospirillum sp. YIM B02556]|uniref:ATP-grasp domain-containing protein n=1 Tax=Azospirillum endophyticum TaxID=2800326 RepID=A0ABS1F6K0_9PROT|nr:hypothetical protein [Azospirillum endophyticum]MBK1838907.1 hypothetical protein [Azospirillum endophyticum]